MPASFVWQPGPTGGTPTNAANLNRLAVTADIGTTGTPTGDALKAAFVPRWQPNTAYTAGTAVLNPSGQVVTANAGFTSGSSYSASNWTVGSVGAMMGGALAAAKEKLAVDPANFKVVILGGSSSDAGTAASDMYSRLFSLHTQPGEALDGVAASDYFADGVADGSTTFTSATANFTSDDVKRVIRGQKFPAGATITAVNSATSITVSAAVPAGTGLRFWVGRHIISGGNNGVPLLDWMTQPGSATMPYNRDRLVADNPDITVASWMINDVRVGLLGTTVDTIVPAGIARMQSFIDWYRAALPGKPLLLRMPNTLLTADVNNNHFITDAQGNVNPPGLAQIYSTAMRRIHLHFIGKYPDVDVIDIQAELLGTRSIASHPLMTDQLHCNPATMTDIRSLTPVGGGYVATADLVAKRIGLTRNAFPPDLAARVRCEFIVYDGPSAGSVRLISRDGTAIPAGQTAVFPGDSLYINGLDGPISLTGATVDRIFSGSTILTLSGLSTTDFSPYIGRGAEVIGTHAPSSTGDRQQKFVDVPNVVAGATVTVNVTVTGAYPGSAGNATVVAFAPGAGFAASGLTAACYPDAQDRVKITVTNPTAAAIDPAGESWTFMVMR